MTGGTLGGSTAPRITLAGTGLAAPAMEKINEFFFMLKKQIQLQAQILVCSGIDQVAEIHHRWAVQTPFGKDQVSCGLAKEFISIKKTCPGIQAHT